MAGKISQYPNAETVLSDGDLIDVSVDIGGGNFESRKMAQLDLRNTLGVNGTDGYLSKYEASSNKIVQSIIYESSIDNNITIGAAGDVAGALLSLVSTTKAFGFPGMTSGQMNLISGLRAGLSVYNSSTQSIWFTNNSNIWKEVATVGNIYFAGSLADTPANYVGHANKLVKVNNDESAVEFGTWQLIGNDLVPVTSGSNIGSASKTIDTIYMSSTIDYAGNISFINASTTRFLFTTDGKLSINLASSPASLTVLGEGNTSGTTNLLLTNNLGQYLFEVKDDGTFYYTTPVGTDFRADFGIVPHLPGGGNKFANQLSSGVTWGRHIMHIGDFTNPNRILKDEYGTTSFGYVSDFYYGDTSNVIKSTFDTTANGVRWTASNQVNGQYAYTIQSSQAVTNAYNAYISQTGFNSTNYALTLNASGATNNRALYVIFGDILHETASHSAFFGNNSQTSFGSTSRVATRIEDGSTLDRGYFTNIQITTNGTFYGYHAYSNTAAAGTGTIYGYNAEIFGASATKYGGKFEFYHGQGTAIGYGIYGKLNVNSGVTSTLGNGYAGYFDGVPDNVNNVTFGDMYGFYSKVGTSHGTQIAGNIYGGYIRVEITELSTVTKQTGLYIQLAGPGSATDNYGIIVNSGLNGFGITAPTARVHFKGTGATSATFNAKFENSAGTLSLLIRDDGSVYNRGGGNIDSNTAFGRLSLLANTIGVSNTAFGNSSLFTNTTGNNNTAIGDTAMFLNLSGGSNVAVGASALYANSTGSSNTAIGVNALINYTGGSNTAVGYRAMNGATTGDDCTGIGQDVLYNNSTGARNTAIGKLAGFTSNAAGNVFLGYAAGFYETGANKLFIDNALRASEADGRIKALIYGVFASATSSQELHINAQKINVDDLPVGNAGVASGELYVDTAANILSNGDYVVARKV